MSENEEKLHYVVNTMALEGMFLTTEEKNVLRDCLEDKYSIDQYIKDTVALYSGGVSK